MKAAKTWSFAGLLFLAGLASVSCGKDEVVNSGSGGKGTVITGGSSTGGSSTGGTRSNDTGGASAGTAGSGTATAATALGQACVTDKECEDAAAPGLTCVTAKDKSLNGGAPPKGLCTRVCTLPTQDAQDDECTAQYGGNSICYAFDQTATTGYCVEGCSFGTPDIGSTKCHNREEFACNPALVGATTVACTDTATDCQNGELCLNGFCNVVFPACLPSCRGDIDCESGSYCDQAFLSGVCVPTKQTGKNLGEPCTVPAAGQPSEPDDCLGFCAPDTAGSSKGHCASNCTLGASCAYNDSTKKFDGACLTLSVITGSTVDAGDFGFCTPTCNCSADCDDATLGCELSTSGSLPATYRGPGLCSPPTATTKAYNHCDGAGGDPAIGAAGAGAGGAP